MEIERDGARLYYTTMGSGPDVVLLHPTPVHHAFWLPMAEQLVSRYRLTLVDLRGHGRSEAGSGIIDMGRLAEDVRAVLRASGIARAVFVGCSIGCYATYEYWKLFPGEIAVMALICGKPQPDSKANRQKRQEWIESAHRPGGLAQFFDLMADTLVGPSTRARHSQVRDTARAMMNTMSLATMVAVQQGLAQRPDSVPTLPTIHVPVCAIAGGEDQSSTVAEMRVIGDQVPNAEFHLLEHAGHYAPLEQPEIVAEILTSFFDRHTISISAKNVAGPHH